MANYKLKEIERKGGYSYFEDEKGNIYSGWNGQGELGLLRSLAKLNDCQERDMPIFTKEYCEYEGYNRNQFDTVEFI